MSPAVRTRGVGARFRAALDGARSNGYESLWVAGKAATAAVLAWYVARLLVPSGSNFYAPLVAVLTVQTTVASTLRDSVQRLSGIGIGLVLGYVELQLFGEVRWWSLGLTLLVATLLSRWHRLGDQGVQIPVAALLMLLFAQHPTSYAETLVLEGVIGALAATLLNLGVPPLWVGSAEEAMVRLRSTLGDALDRMSSALAEWPPDDASWSAQVQDAGGALEQARRAVERGSESVRLNFRARGVRHVPRDQRAALLALEHVVLSVREIDRLLAGAASHDDPSLQLDPHFRPELAALLRSVASALNSYGEPAGGADVAAEERPVSRAQAQVARLQERLAARETSGLPALLAEGALLTLIERVVRELRQAPLHEPGLAGAGP
jgi:uncharacterized membrane protein YccC